MGPGLEQKLCLVFIAKSLENVKFIKRYLKNYRQRQQQEAFCAAKNWLSIFFQLKLRSVWD